MQTWFDRYRGISQGRIVPASLTPPHGERIFVLGEDSPTENARLTTGDFTEIRQVVDLTDWDMVLATMETIGRITGSAQSPPAWTNESAELFKFYFDYPNTTSFNSVIPLGESAGFTFDSVGPIVYPTESYSGGNTHCREIPAGNTVPCHLEGVHTPPVATPLTPLPQYTLQFWMNLDVDSLPSSWGVDFNLISFYSIVGPNRHGILLSFYGLSGPGAHLWYPYLTHFYNASYSGVGFDVLYDIETNQGWELITITYDETEAPLNRVSMFLDDTYLGHPNFSMNMTPGIPASGYSGLQYGDQYCWGQLDACRLLNRVMSPSEVAAAYAELTTPRPLVNTKWAQQILIDGEVYANRILQVDEARRWTDFKAPVRRLSGLHEVTFRFAFREES